MTRLASAFVWGGLAALGAAAFGVLALSRGESISAAWLLIAALCSYAIGYRFYSKFLANRVFGLDDRRATPAERRNNGRDFVPTNRFVLYGHHFAAIAGAGPLVGPVLAAQFGYLPARCGSSSASSLPEPCRTSRSCSARCAGTGNRSVTWRRMRSTR